MRTVTLTPTLPLTLTLTLIYKIIIGKLPVKAIYALQVVSRVLKHNYPKIIPNTFQLEPIEFRITTRILKPKLLQMKDDNRKMVKMKATQLPVISNQAQTARCYRIWWRLSTGGD